MGKRVPDPRIDEQLAVCEGVAIHLCSAEPTTYTEATTTYNLASKAVDSGDYIKANGDTSGRKNTLTPDPAADATANGEGTHVAVTRTSDTTLRYVTTCPPVDVTSDGEVNFAPLVHEIGDLT